MGYCKAASPEQKYRRTEVNYLPAPKRRFYSAKDIETILGVSRSKAIQIMHIFEKRGQLFRLGNTLRVEIDVFERWQTEQTGQRVT